jgi:hypothetical protein
MTIIRGSQEIRKKSRDGDNIQMEKWSAVHMFWRWLIFNPPSHYEYEQLEFSRALNPLTNRNLLQLVKEKRSNSYFFE